MEEILEDWQHCILLCKLSLENYLIFLCFSSSNQVCKSYRWRIGWSLKIGLDVQDQNITGTMWKQDDNKKKCTLFVSFCCIFRWNLQLRLVWFSLDLLWFFFEKIDHFFSKQRTRVTQLCLGWDSFRTGDGMHVIIPCQQGLFSILLYLSYPRFTVMQNCVWSFY